MNIRDFMEQVGGNERDGMDPVYKAFVIVLEKLDALENGVKNPKKDEALGVRFLRVLLNLVVYFHGISCGIIIGAFLTTFWREYIARTIIFKNPFLAFFTTLAIPITVFLLFLFMSRHLNKNKRKVI